MTTTTITKDPSATTGEKPASLPRQVREKTGLTEARMAELMGMSQNGYALWEKGARRPGGPAYRLLQLIENDPKGVIAALR